jgi:regulatory protein
MNDYETARQIAIRYADYAARTAAQVRRRLERAQIPEAIIQTVLADLQRMGLVDDDRFSRDWVESRIRRKGLGPSRLTHELRQRGIAPEVAEEAVRSADPQSRLEAALALARKHLRTHDPADPAVQRRLAAFLQRRGHDWETIEKVFSILNANNN